MFVIDVYLSINLDTRSGTLRSLNEKRGLFSVIIGRCYSVIIRRIVSSPITPIYKKEVRTGSYFFQ
jgi:hypothetical protein